MKYDLRTNEFVCSLTEELLFQAASQGGEGAQLAYLRAMIGALEPHIKNLDGLKPAEREDVLKQYGNLRRMFDKNPSCYA